MKQSSLLILLAVVMLATLVGCPRPLLTPQAISPSGDTLSLGVTTELRGQVDWGTRGTLADPAEIANGATVSLIDATTGVTASTTVTTPQGQFSLKFPSSFRPQADTPYYLEAVKGLRAGGDPNRAGANAARMRTMVYWENGGWVSITSPIPGAGVYVGRATTTLCIVDSLRSYSASPVNRRALVGSLTIGSPDVFTPGSTGISSSEYSTVFNFVAQALTLNEDPVFVVTYNVRTGAYTKITTTVALSGVIPSVGRIGEQIVIIGNNFSSDASRNRVRFNGMLATELSANGSGTRLTVRVPVGATTGFMLVEVDDVVFGGLSFRVLSWDGHTPFDTDGNLYVGGGAANALFRIAPSGQVTKWLEGNGLSAPAGVTVDGSNNVYVANKGANTVMRVAPDLTVSVFASGGGLNQPEALAFDRWGNLYIANRGSNAVLRVPPTGGTPAAYVSNASFNQPVGLAFDGTDNLWVASWNGNAVLRVATGSLAVTTPVVGLNRPGGVAFDAEGNLFIANYGENQVLRYSAAGFLSPILTSPGVHLGIKSVAFNTNGLLHMGAYDSHTVLTLDRNGAVRDLALAPRNAWGIARDSGCNLYIGINNFTRRFRRGDDDRVYVVPYDASTGTYGPYGIVSSGFRSPNGVAFDSAGRFYVADYETSRVYRVNVTTGVKSLYTTPSGRPMSISFGPSDRLQIAERWASGPQTVTTGGTWNTYAHGRRPLAVVGDGTNLYVSSQDDGSISRINSDGTTDIYATGLNFPHGLAWYGGSLYVAEYNSNRVSRISSTGVRSDFSTSGLNRPTDLVFDGSGNAYVTCAGDGTVKRIPSTGGPAQAFASGLSTPLGIAIFGTDLYVVNDGNDTVSRVPLSTGVPALYATLDTGESEHWGIAVDGAGVAYVTGNTRFQSRGAVFRIPAGGGSWTRWVDAGTRIGKTWMDAGGRLYAPNYQLRVGAVNGALLSSWVPSVSTARSLHGIAMTQVNGLASDSLGRLIGATGRIQGTLVRWNANGTGFFKIGDLGSVTAGPTQVYVDAADNVYVACINRNRVLKFTRVSDTSFTSSDMMGVGWASGVVADPAGNLFVTSMSGAAGNAPLVTIPSGQSAAQVIPHWFYQPDF